MSRLLERFSIATLGLTDHRKFDAATSGMNFAQSQIWIRLGGFLGILLTTKSFLCLRNSSTGQLRDR